LCEWAEREFELGKPDKDGIALREHLEQIERQTGKRPKELENTDFPTLASNIWSAFIALSSSRSSGFSGPNPITFSEIKSWMQLTHSRLAAWEVEALKAIDLLYIKVHHG